MIVNVQTYYEYDGTLYAQEFNANNEVLYTVVGVHGVLDNTQLSAIDNTVVNPSPSLNDPVVPLNNSNIQTLPANCKVVEENGQKYYLSPQNIYYQEIIGADGTVSYQIVNMSTSPNSY